MKNELYFYLAEPTVALVGKLTEITVTPLDSRYAFADGEEYLAQLLPMRDYRRGFDFEAVTVGARASDGKLHLAYTFPSEGEYTLRVFENRARLDEKVRIMQLQMYALDADLYSRRPMKGDTHVHSCRSDGKETPAVVAANYRAAGFDFMALTDHSRYAPSVEAIEAYKDVKLGMIQLYGEEVHSPETYLHIVNFGGSFSVNKLFADDREGFMREVGEIMKTADIPELSEGERFVYASALWCIEKIRQGGGVAIYPHPHWIVGGNAMYNVPDEMNRAIMLGDIFDAFELIGGQSAHENNFQTQHYYELREEYFEKYGKRMSIPVVGASDSHGTINSGWFDRKYTVVFAKSRSAQDIKDAILEGYSCAVEVYEDSSNYTVHGSYRLMSYARFLCENYFPRTREICAVEGKLMREYLLGGDGELLSALAGRVEGLAVRYFSR